MSTPFNLIMLSAHHEAGGNCLQRFLDSHPQLFVYPTESQISTPLSSNILAGPAHHWVPQRYSYPEFTMGTTPEQAYHQFWDEEVKTYLRAKDRSKFRDCGMEMTEKDRIARFEQVCRDISPDSRGTRATYVEAYFRSTFDAWTNFRRTGKETHYVGYSPPILFDTPKILADFPTAHIVHVVRNPWSGYADTKKRPFPMSLDRYCQIWSVCQLMAETYSRKHPESFCTIRYEDLVADPARTLDEVLAWAGLDPFPADSPPRPSFNRVPLDTVYPWGTIRYATPAANAATARELTTDETRSVYQWCGVMMDRFGYTDVDDQYYG